MDTREQIKQYGEGKDYWFYPWSGRVGLNPFPIRPEYQLEGTHPNGEGGLTGPPHATPEEAVADRERYINEDNRDYTGWTWRVVKNECFLKISIEKELGD